MAASADLGRAPRPVADFRRARAPAPAAPPHRRPRRRAWRAPPRRPPQQRGREAGAAADHQRRRRHRVEKPPRRLCPPGRHALGIDHARHRPRQARQRQADHRNAAPVGAARRARQVEPGHRLERRQHAALRRMVGPDIAARFLAEEARRGQESGVLARAVAVEWRGASPAAHSAAAAAGRRRVAAAFEVGRGRSRSARSHPPTTATCRASP